ncbi:SusD/RagB family nutrient-binding outer membrane lipoprotein [Aureibaculum marinum]|uniref:SusD/RagB family nutrient-binding outer membrane lipoprotein n=2 Tax=Pseudomonadati TaxID=3379134 RepID=A0A3N4PAE7_9FLAO|nr:SusD/RagB family nutrient-binding outer membrane lipoprotein [Aureibaculum marinum]RPD96473.1 SusD/RagB family nutrient-binding outer membrane lipoprotein [Aureibaculum marinum]
MKNLKYILLATISLIITYSCDNFEDINTNPDKSTLVAPEMLATQVLKNTFTFNGSGAFEYVYGNLFNKHVALLTAVPNGNQYYYATYGSFGAYSRLTDLEYMVEFAEGSVSQPSYKGLALFLKAYYGFSATLAMGDVPYSEAGLASEGNTRPVYDKQADVIVQILEDLKQAEAYFAEGNNFAGDIMYDGDASKWQKLCNAMQLKVIQTISKKATAEQKARFAEIVNTGVLMEDNDDNLKLVYTETPNANHEFYNGENLRITTAISKLAADFLKENNDRRLFYFAEPAQKLIDDGMSESDFDAYVGALTSEDPTTLAFNNDNGEYSLLNERYVQFMDGEPMLRFTYSEQCFIIAEAIEEGWVTGDAQEYYENGVKAMLEYYMNLPHTEDFVHGMAIDQAYIDNYFTGAAAYATGGSKEDRLKQILTQRWLIDFFQGNGGNYPQFLRTGYPEYPLDPSTSLNPDDTSVYPKRYKYPASEQNTNPENYQKAIDDQFGGYDGINKTPWYLQD